MINLCNDVLNQNRRNLFPKIQTLNNKLSLYSLIFLKNQNPLHFYKSFYKTIFKDSNKYLKNKSHKNSSCLSLLSKTQNYYYSLPIKYKYNLGKIKTKYNDNQKNIVDVSKHNSLLKKNESNLLDLLHNKNLRKIHEYLVNNEYEKMKLNDKMGYQSCKDIYKENSSIGSDSNNSIINDKVSRGQQTISNGNNIQNIEKLINIRKDEKFKRIKKIKYKIINEDKNEKFIFHFQNKSSKKLQNKNYGSNNKIKVIWRNLRRPISMNFNSFKIL